jgi:hypothetical protein
VRHAQKIHLVPPPGALLSAGIFCITYPTGVVGIPSTGIVTGRGRASTGLSLNDFQRRPTRSWRIPLTDATAIISFDLCTGATAPWPSDFTCVVKNA